MIRQVRVPVSVNLVYNHKKNRVAPVALTWDGELRKITSVDLHHSYRVGQTLYHVFSVSTQGAFFKLVFNTQNLYWEVEEVGCE